MKKLLLVTLLAWLTGCSSQTSKSAPEAKPTPKPPEYVSGRSGFQKAYVAARQWARDAQPYRIESQPTAEAKGKDGKAAVWRSYFASPAQAGVKPFVWSGADATDAPVRGITSGTEDSYSPTNSSTQIFDSQFLKIDSDKAVEVAQKHGGEKVLEKNPEISIFYLCDWSKATNELIWHVIYGESLDNPKLRVAVNATSGEFMRVEK
jgi:hypothetical protein